MATKVPKGLPSVIRTEQIRAQIDVLAERFLAAKGPERVRLTLEYMDLKEQLADLPAGG